jgi:hypothetical protein
LEIKAEAPHCTIELALHLANMMEVIALCGRKRGAAQSPGQSTTGEGSDAALTKPPWYFSPAKKPTMPHQIQPTLSERSFLFLALNSDTDRSKDQIFAVMG